MRPDEPGAVIPSEKSAMPGWMIVVLVVQGALALLFFAMTWSHTSSLTMGRTPPWQDLALMSAPFVGVLLCAWLARKRRANAAIIVFLPFPMALLLFGLIGAI